MDASIPPQQKLLRVICPKMDGLSFRQMRKVIRTTADAYKSLCEREGSATPFAFLFSECALKYAYSVRPSKVQRHIDKIQRLLPRDIWISVHFPAMEKEKGTTSNMGYSLTKGQREFAPKRAFTVFDDIKLGCIEQEGQQAAAWGERGNKMSQAAVPYPSLRTPGGLLLEHRVCIDIVSDPIQAGKNAVTLVSAHRLQLAGTWLRQVQARGNSIVVNYDSNNKVQIFSADANPSWQWSVERESDLLPIILLSQK